MSDFWGGPSDEFRGARGSGGGGGRRRRVDLRAAVLRLLAEQPMNGSQVIQELSSRSGGRWSPRPESVYAVLQMLEDEGLVTVTESAEGRRLQELTEAGRAEAERLAGAGAESARTGPGESGDGEVGGDGGESRPEDLLTAIADAARVFVAAAASADSEQRAKLVAALREFRQAVLEAVPGADRSGSFPPWGWGWGGGPGRGGGGRGWFPDIPDWLASVGGGGWPGRPGGGWRRGPGGWWPGWPGGGPASRAYEPDEEGDDEMW